MEPKLFFSAPDPDPAPTFQIISDPDPAPDPASDPVPDPAPDPAPDPVPDPAKFFSKEIKATFFNNNTATLTYKQRF